MTGDLAQRVAERLISLEGTAAAWNLMLEEVREGYARVSMKLRADRLNGGMVFALADSAFAYACNSRNELTVAQQASILFLAPAHEGDILVAEAWEDARAGRVGASVTVTIQSGGPIAQFQDLSRTTGGTVLSKQEQE